MCEIKTNELFTQSLPTDLVTEQGQTNIKNLLQDYLYRQLNGTFYEVWNDLYKFLDSELDWSWVTSRGTLPKRLSRHIYNNHKAKLSKELLAEIGNIGKQHSDGGGEYHFDFSRGICDWVRGEFGDPESCFFSCHSAAQDMLYNLDAYVMRFFSPSPNEYGGTYYENYYGLGRAWMVPWSGNFVFFNGYGLPLLRMVRIFTQWSGLDYKKIGVANNGNESGTLWINNGRGYVVGKTQDILKINNIDFHEEDPEGSCSSCGYAVGEDYYRHDGNGEIYCPDCWFDFMFCCEECGDYHDRDYEHVHDGYGYCESCFNQMFAQCNSCGDVYGIEEVIYSEHDDAQYCTYCCGAHCEECREFFHNDDLEDGLCEACVQESEECDQEECVSA